MKIKRYQMWTRNGLEWSHWFQYDGSDSEKWQLKNKLRNEYKEVTDEEWFLISQQ